ncbi:putative permease [Candidatus Rhodobacter oscarellae]|uniref:Putative permease n=1 Tax=Candidatus Rhodobacter oscarellae TaxID=1675527 RepID=A0A0J9E357_9RHOB|nr:LPS export ABC transporter permease LptF [Candidatus Rhodobacter lobularis]KMW56234.1 putative permease [Candidatus Rhodobacter lobularis]
MTRFDRYVLSQLLMLFGLFSLILVMVYWVNRAVVLFDQLIANGQSAGVFFEFTALTLPNVIRLVLPISAFAASLYVANRLSSESELLVAKAAGHSPYRLARPVLAFGVIVALMVALLTHFLVPLSIARLAEREAEISQNITARLLNEGQFLHPTDGFTFYIREVTPAGELKDVFLNDARGDTEHVTYTARQALLVRHESGPKLVMFDGMAQTLNVADNRLSVTRFEDFAYSIATLIGSDERTARGVKELSTRELVAPSQAVLDEVGLPLARLLSEGHGRSQQALLAIVAALVGFAAMMIGSFNRFGLWRQIIGALVAIILLKSADNAFADMARSDPGLWLVSYGATPLGIAMTLILLWISDKPMLFKRRHKPETDAEQKP